MPFDIGIGGFRRSYNVLPLLAKRLSEEFEVEVYIPANAIRTAIKFYLEQLSENATLIKRDLVEEASQKALNDINDLLKRSNYSFTFNEKVFIEALKINKQVILHELKNSLMKSVLWSFMECFRPTAVEVFERNFCDRVKKYFASYTWDVIYSMHETPDALRTAIYLGDKRSYSIVLLQLDTGSNLPEKLVSIQLFRELVRKTTLKGILTVSPQPILESPHILRFINLDNMKIKILFPACAIHEHIFKYSGSEKNPYTAIYFGRISVEKGMLDLLRAWGYVMEKVHDAKLSIVGRFDKEYDKKRFFKMLRGSKVKNISYLGYVPQDKLFDITSRHSLLIYPSYRDSFSLVVLEALAMGLNVIAYDIPALRYLYSCSSLVKLVPKGNYTLLAKVLVKTLKEPPKKIDSYTKMLLKAHSSWESVVNEEYNKVVALIH
jgi:glycosyltransferase involved in cell wall biosynthesis